MTEIGSQRSEVSNLWSVVRQALALSFFATMLFALGFSAQAQQPPKLYKVGRLTAGSPVDPGSKSNLDAFREGLRDLGWVENQNIVVENRWLETKPGRFAELAAELIRLGVDVIVASGTEAIQAAKRSTSTIPIVMAGSGSDPVRRGFVAGLAQPGGNITGLSLLVGDLNAKRLELLKENVPKVSQVGVLSNTARNQASGSEWIELEVTARSLGVKLQAPEVRSPRDLESAFLAMNKAGAGGLLVLGDPVLLERNRGSIIVLALKYRLAAIYPWKSYVEEGGLISYGTDLRHMHRRAAYYVDKILKGAKPADLPVEQPMKFELVINLKTAKQLGITIPPNVLARADRVIK